MSDTADDAQVVEDEWPELERLVGRIVMLDVALEQALRHAFTAMLPHPLAPVVAPHMFGGLLDACRALVKAHGLIPNDIRNDFLDALKYAEDAHELRNRATHDALFPTFDERQERPYTRIRYKRGQLLPEGAQVGIDDFHATVEALRRARVRIGTLWILLIEPTDAPTRKLLRGEFKVISNGVILHDE